MDVLAVHESISIGMYQSENTTQPRMFAIAVGGDQPDVRLLCQPSLAANRSMNILACALLRKNWRCKEQHCLSALALRGAESK